MKIAMVFPGYGSQFVGMAKELYDESRLIQEYFEEASNCSGINFIKLCFASSESELKKMDNAYESIFLVSSSIAALLAEHGVVPGVVAGYGLGEYSAVCAVGGLSLPDGLYFLAKYAQFYQELVKTLDVRVIKVHQLVVKKVETVCDEVAKEQDPVGIGVYLSDNRCIVTGIGAQVARVQEQLIGLGGKVEESSLEAGLHSSLMNPVVDQLAVYLEKIDFKELRVPLIASLNGKKISEGDLVRQQIMTKINHAVQWNSVVSALDECDVIIEVGPGRVLSAALADRYSKKRIVSVNEPADLDMVKRIVSI